MAKASRIIKAMAMKLTDLGGVKSHIGRPQISYCLVIDTMIPAYPIFNPSVYAIVISYHYISLLYGFSLNSSYPKVLRFHHVPIEIFHVEVYFYPIFRQTHNIAISQYYTHDIPMKSPWFHEKSPFSIQKRSADLKSGGKPSCTAPTRPETPRGDPKGRL